MTLYSLECADVSLTISLSLPPSANVVHGFLSCWFFHQCYELTQAKTDIEEYVTEHIIQQIHNYKIELNCVVKGMYLTRCLLVILKKACTSPPNLGLLRSIAAVNELLLLMS